MIHIESVVYNIVDPAVFRLSLIVQNNNSQIFHDISLSSFITCQRTKCYHIFEISDTFQTMATTYRRVLYNTT